MHTSILIEIIILYILYFDFALIKIICILVFVYDRNKFNVLEVNKVDYDRCIARRPVHNWTTGAGRDVLPLNVTKTYYFISGKGACYKGMKLSIRVENSPRHL